MDINDKDDLLESIALDFQDQITNSYTKLAEECFNTTEHFLEMKTEAVIRSAYFRSTRRYAQWITKQEGVKKDKLDVKGLEFKKANFPPLFGEFSHNILVDILKGANQKEIDIRVKEFKNKIVNNELLIKDLGNPTSIKTLNKYMNRKAMAGEIFSTMHKGTPAAVRAAIKHNDLLKFWRLNKEHRTISQGDKIKWVYLKKNPYQIEAIAFLDYDIAPQIEEFINKYIDLQKIFDSILLNKVEGLYSDLNWSLQLNPYINKFFNI
jgi:DNA polymerase elongation subunit (family B)